MEFKEKAALQRVLDEVERDSDAALFAISALYARLGQFSEIEALLVGSAQKDKAWATIDAATKFARGDAIVLTQHGFSKSLAAEGPERVSLILAGITGLLKRIKEHFEISCYYTSGTLLGLIRSGTLIPHDDDIDTAYVSNETDMANVVLERIDILKFINGLPDHRAVNHLPCLIHCYLPLDDGSRYRFDLFTAWIEDGFVSEYPLPRGRLRAESVLPIRIEHFYSAEIPLPAVPEHLLEVNYGNSWQIPDPTFRFDWTAAGVAYGPALVGFRSIRSAGYIDWLEAESRRVTKSYSGLENWRLLVLQSIESSDPDQDCEVAWIVGAEGEYLACKWRTATDFIDSLTVAGEGPRGAGILVLQHKAVRSGHANEILELAFNVRDGAAQRTRLLGCLEDGSICFKLELAV